MLEDKTIDIVSIATPNHWHALAAIWAIQAGKDVYVEKPVSHNVSEGRRIVQAARKHGRIVQTGTQSRSAPGMRAAIEYVAREKSATSSWPADCATSSARRSVRKERTRFRKRSTTTCGSDRLRKDPLRGDGSTTIGTGSGTTGTATWETRGFTRWTSAVGGWAKTISGPA